MTYTEQLNRLTRQYNDAIRALEDAFNWENSQLGWNLSDIHLTRQYSKKYDALAREYRGETRQLFTSYQMSHPQWAKWRRFWSWTFVVGIVLFMGSCIAQLPVREDTPAPSASPMLSDSQAVSNSTADRYWNAEDIPIPFLQDSTQYVSNPDHVLTQQTVNHMNATLKRLDNELGIESVVIVVNHIANDDPYRMAQDVGNRYGVGRGNRGLVVVVGYQDHSVNISPGRALEADLTDAECHRLQQRYVVPAMRAEKPDSAMWYLTEAIYSTLQKKDMPVMSRLSGKDDDADEQTMRLVGIYLLVFIGGVALFLRLNSKYQWMPLTGSVALLSNPFRIYSDSSGGVSGGFGGFGGFRGGFGGGGGSFGGGSFGGGSFGGGGATSRW